ncbi:MAG: hypothetical protein KBG28_02305 [Kofleriaceae bacterium]|nr:hypothetical protein [Kofleriaceae bacterium]
MANPPRFRDALVALTEHGVDFVVVGGVAAVLAGAPVSTFDLDFVHDRDETNVTRLLAALTALDARYRDPAGGVLRPSASDMEGPGHHLLDTLAGPLDVLGTMIGGRDYHTLVGHAEEVSLGQARIRVLGLRELITVKAELGRDKDLAVLATLRRTLAERGS